MRLPSIAIALIGASLFLWCGQSFAEPSITLEIVAEPGAPLTGQQKWAEVFKGLPVDNVRLVSSQGGERANIETTGEGVNARYRVVGILTSSNQLLLPGGRFSPNDKASIRVWLEKLKGGGQEGLGARPAAFGLAAKELVALHESLAAPVGFATKSQRIGDAVDKIARNLGKQFSFDETARMSLAGKEAIAEEFQATSTGTALAAIVRPLGLVLLPRKNGADVALTIVDVRATTESWPIGWPAQKPARDLVPKLHEFLNFEVDDRPVAEVVDAVAGRLQIPFYYDHNSLARQKIDPTTFKVSVPDGKTYYKKILDTVLFKARLTMEVRVDEAGKPLVWVSTIKR